MGPVTLLAWLGGFNIFNPEKLAKLFFYVVLIAGCIGAYHKLFIAPTIKNIQRTSIQHVENLYLAQDSKKSNSRFVGLQIWKPKIGVSW